MSRERLWRMTVYRIKLLLVLVVLLILSGCGYRITGFNASNTDYNGRTVWVDFIGNTTGSSTAQTNLKRGFLEEFHAFRGMLPSTVRSESDLVVSGSIRSYTIRAVSYTAADQVRENRLSIEVELEVRERTSLTALWKGVISASQDFPASDPLNPNLALQKNAEEAALVAASRKLAQTLITSMEVSY